MAAFNVMIIELGLNRPVTLITDKESGEALLDLFQTAVASDYLSPAPRAAHDYCKVHLTRHEDLTDEQKQLYRKLRMNPFKNLPIKTASGLRDDSTEKPDIPDMTPY